MQSNPIEQAALADVPASQDGKGLALRVQQVVKRYGGREVLHGIHLQAAPGEFLAIVGRSGCGKSTLLRLVAGLEDSDGGGVTLDGVPGNKQREAVRVMFQDARLLPWKKVLDNVALGLPRARLADAARVLGQVGLAERAGEWPARLSGGQRQRVALARALVHHPRLLLLDEPLGALDALTRIEMQGLIEALWQRLGFTALLVTHDVSEAVALADRVVLIEDGRIALDQRVALPRPRQRGSAAFAQLEDAVLRRVMQRDGTSPVNESQHGQALLSAVDWSVARTVDSVRWAI
ncbi:ATP-binding cassette domain-containing protein [Cupriavidus sp. D39]|uniref:ATP-binding cassette domain-containing protein n=1 Tax=Cupriavidus sp. D39 TaxID=2997877 RepID=UPI00226E38B1|nr:ATP-binding cassette domain-containing protein [Cupriavidus sp. D39]MCY0855514.1 ATP-binding cassette domain-containing protein [Cupriavidus sp. D39]